MEKHKKLGWHHLNIWFNPGFTRKIHNENWIDAMLYIKRIICACNLRDYFHLFEPEPHLFLAFKSDSLKFIKQKIEKIPLPKKIKKISFSFDTKDDACDSHALGFFKASTDYAIWKATSGEYKIGYDNMDESKMIHCFFNALGYSHPEELDKYFYCALQRGAYFIDFTNTLDWKRYHIKTKKFINLEYEQVHE